MHGNTFLAIDLGAESGRAIAGTLRDGRLTLEEIHRFRNGIERFEDGDRWDFERLFLDVRTSLRICAERNIRLDSVGIDSWGVDYALLDEQGRLLDRPFAYRDSRNVRAMDDVVRRLGRERLYASTGIQVLPFNTLFQLYDDRRRDRIERARGLLFTADYFAYLLSGAKCSEYTLASTSQLLDPALREWRRELFEELELPLSIMQPLVPPGTPLGCVSPDIAIETGVGEVPVIATASHDTAAAVASLPAGDAPWTYISSGTWSLMGMETASPIISDRTFRHNFTNEGGVAGTVRLLKNITGLWILQQCVKAWKLPNDRYETLIREAENALPFRCIIDPDHPSFVYPPDMPAAIVEFCARSGQPAPSCRAEFTRTILESLALKYRLVLEQLRDVTGMHPETIYVTGGGSRNDLLNRFTADATGLPVQTALPEGSAAGNIMTQAMALGCVASLQDARSVIARSFASVTYEPRETDRWAGQFDTFTRLSSATENAAVPSRTSGSL